MIEDFDYHDDKQSDDFGNFSKTDTVFKVYNDSPKILFVLKNDCILCWRVYFSKCILLVRWTLYGGSEKIG